MEDSRISDFRIDTAEIDAQVYASLPQSVRDLIHAYSEKLRRVGNRIVFEMPAYRWEEIQAELMVGRADKKHLGITQGVEGAKAPRVED